MQKAHNILLFIVLTLVGSAYFNTVSIGAEKKVNLYNKEGIIVQIDVEIADTPEERNRGLMFRERLNQREGMLFIFDEENLRVFWMKNTLINLDMIFISKDLQVVSFIKGARPCKSSPCMKYHSKYPAMYVLEVNAGFVDKYEIDNRTRIDILPGEGLN